MDWSLKRSRNHVPCGVTGQSPVANLLAGVQRAEPSGALRLQVAAMARCDEVARNFIGLDEAIMEGFFL
jgi:hypothetical protein